MRIRGYAGRLLAGAVAVLAGALPAADRYMLPEGAGAKDGSNWENALSYQAAPDALQKACDALQGGDTLYLGGGDYAAAGGVVLRADGNSEKETRRICGQERGGRLPRFTGAWEKNSKEKGFSFLQIAGGARWWSIENLEIAGCREGVIVQKQGNASHGRLLNLRLQGVRDGFVLIGNATADKPESGTHDIAIKDCSVVNYTKKAYRVRGGCRNITLENCLADAGGKEWATEAFQMSYTVMGGEGNVFDHDITFINCVGRNNYWDAGEKYWNGDAFDAERNTYNLTFIGCSATDNTDGGWDLKTRNALLIGCVALRNKRNYRFWSSDPGTVLVGCLGAYAKKTGGSGSEDGLWTAGKVLAVQCSLVENACSLSFDSGRPNALATLRDCIVTLANPQTIGQNPNVKLENSAVWKTGGRAGEAPGLARAAEAVQTRDAGTLFDSKEYGATKGYHSGWSKETMLAAGRKLQPLLTAEQVIPPAKEGNK